MALPDWKQIVFSKNGALYSMYSAVKTELAAIRAGIPEDDSITAIKLMAGIVGYAKLDTNIKQYPLIIRIKADAAATDLPDRSLFVADKAVKVISCTIIPDTTFGQGTDYAGLSLVNKGAAGAGTTVLASKNFNSGNVATAHEATSLGTVSNPNVAAGDVLSLVKTKSGDGQIVPDAAIELILERAA